MPLIQFYIAFEIFLRLDNPYQLSRVMFVSIVSSVFFLLFRERAPFCLYIYIFYRLLSAMGWIMFTYHLTFPAIQWSCSSQIVKIARIYWFIFAYRRIKRKNKPSGKELERYKGGSVWTLFFIPLYWWTYKLFAIKMLITSTCEMKWQRRRRRHAYRGIDS